MQRNILLNIGKFSTKSWNQTQTKMGFSRFFWKPWSYTQSIDKSITVIWYIRRITNEEMCCWKIIPLENVSIVDAWTAHRYVSSILATLKEKLFLQRTPPNHCFWQKTNEKLKREFIVRKNIFQTINVRDDVMWTIFLYFYSYWAITREKKISLFILQLFTLILQSTVVGTQTAIYVELCPVRSSSDSSSFLNSFFFRMKCSQFCILENLTMALSLYEMTWLDLLPRYVKANMLTRTTHFWLKSSTDIGIPTSAAHLHREYWAFFQ